MLQRIRRLAGVVVLAVAGLAAPAVHASDRANPFQSVTPVRVQGTIVDVAVGNPDFSTLVTALTAANLVTTLQGKGPFTVFAPTNAAFAQLPPAILQYLLANPAELTKVLLYHVAPGRRDLGYSFFPTPVKTVQGQEVYAYAKYDRATNAFRIVVNNSTVLVRPIAASNGTVYVIDSVLLPQYR